MTDYCSQRDESIHQFQNISLFQVLHLLEDIGHAITKLVELAHWYLHDSEGTSA